MSYAMMKRDDYDMMSKLSVSLAKSGFFRDAQGAAQAFVKVMAGAELGLAPFAAMTAFHVIEGRPALAANTYAAFIRRHAHYDYRVKEQSRTACEIEFLRGEKDPKSGRMREPESLGTYRVTLDECDKAGITQGKEGRKKNWRSHPDAMLFARAVSQGCRFHCPDVFSGTVYTREEMEDVREVDAVLTDAAPPTFTPGSEAEIGAVEQQAAREGREVEIDEPEWGLGPNANSAQPAPGGA